MRADSELAAQYPQMVSLQEAATMLQLRTQRVQSAWESLRLQQRAGHRRRTVDRIARQLLTASRRGPDRR